MKTIRDAVESDFRNRGYEGIEVENRQLPLVAKIPLSQKKKFLVDFTEDEFRDKVVHPLFQAQGYEFGKDTCGPDEEGKDSYYWIEYPLVGRTLTVVQTKRGKLNMSKKPRENVEEAATQMKTAINTEVNDLSTGTRCLPSAAILVVSGDVNTAARKHITERVSDGRLRFLDADDIIPQIDRHMPEFWNGIDADKLPYLKELRNELLERTDTIDVSEIGINAGTPSPITDDTFTQLWLHRYTTKSQRKKGEVSERLDIDEIKVQDLLTKRDCLFMMTGDAGAGKTTSLNRMALITVDAALKKPDSPLPICLTCDMLTGEEELVSVATEETRSKTKDKKAAFSTDDLENGKLSFFIDGLDELPEQSHRERVFEQIESFHAKYPRCKFVIASRDYPFIHKLLDEHPNFHRYHITPLSFTQAGKMIERLSQGRSLAESDTKEMLRRLENIHGLQLNPLLVTVFVATSDYARADLPANITELFKKFTELMLGRWKKSKSVRQQFHQPLKDFLLKKFAFKLHSEKTTSMREADFHALIKRELEERDHSTDFETLYFELVTLSGLLRVEDGQVLFRHMMLQEFYAGRGIESEEYLSEIVTDVWWTKAVVFYFGEHPDNSSGLMQLRNGVDKIIGGDSFQASVAIGLACQACYLLKASDKQKTMKWVVEQLALIRSETVSRFQDDRKDVEILPLVHYFLYGRDAVASKTIGRIAKKECDQILSQDNIEEFEESTVYWYISGLIESRQLELAYELVKKFKPSDDKLLYGIYMGAFYVQHIHIADSSDKKIAEKICRLLGPTVDYLRQIVIKELKTVLLETRNGEVTAIED